jgi:hypothetical protein
MNTDEIRRFLKRQPFIPFTIHMNDGRKLGVNHPDFVAIHPEDRMNVIVFLPNKHFEFGYLKNVTSIRSEGEIPQRDKRKKGNGSEE